MYEIYVRDAHLNRIGQITDFTQLDLIPRFNAVGSFALDLPTDSFAARELIKPKAGIIVKKDGVNIFSGTVTGRQRSFNADGDNLTLSGVDDIAHLANRLAYPEPSAQFNLADYDVRTGLAEKIIKEYVSVNAGPDAPITSRNVLSIEANKGLGSKVIGRARFHNLLEFLSSLALTGGGLGLNVVQVGQSLEFRVYQPTDKTKTAFFSPLLGNLAEFEYSHDNPEANMVIVGGGGEGKERILKWKQDNASIAKFGRIESFIDQRNTTDIEELNQSMDERLVEGKERILKWKQDNASIAKFGRIESFIDQRNTTDIEELNQSMDEGLVEGKEQHSFSFTPIDTPQLAFNRDYSLGDKVSVILTQPNEVIDIETLYYFISAYQSVPVATERVRKIQSKLDVIQDLVREVKISITPEGDFISPNVGTEDSNTRSILGIFEKMKKLSKRINHLERR
jgi:hypothetical protein